MFKDYEVANFIIASVLSAHLLGRWSWAVEMDGLPAPFLIAIPFLLANLAAQYLIRLFPFLFFPYITVGCFAFGVAILLFFYFFPNQWVQTKSFFAALGGGFVYVFMVALAVAFQQALVVVIALFLAALFLQRRYV